MPVLADAGWLELQSLAGKQAGDELARRFAKVYKGDEKQARELIDAFATMGRTVTDEEDEAVNASLCASHP